MSNKGKDYGIVTQEVINGREQTTGRSRTFSRELTKADILYAMAVLLKANPNFDKLSVSIAADRITQKLRDLGFTGTLSNSGGKIKDDSGNTFQISHGKYKGESILTVTEKKKG